MGPTRTEKFARKPVTKPVAVAMAPQHDGGPSSFGPSSSSGQTVGSFLIFLLGTSGTRRANLKYTKDTPQRIHVSWRDVNGLVLKIEVITLRKVGTDAIAKVMIVNSKRQGVRSIVALFFHVSV